MTCICERCGEEVRRVVRVNNGGWCAEDWCEACAEEYAMICASCGELTAIDEMAEVRGAGMWCPSCRDDAFYCDECDEWVRAEDWNDDRDACLRCAPRSLVLPYHTHKHDAQKREFVGKAPSAWGDWRGLSFELEVDRGDESRHAEATATAAVHELTEGRVMFERDGSLDHGFEIITQPHTERAFDKFPLDEMCAALVAAGYSSHNTSTCGLHIHITRSMFGATEDEQERAIAKVMTFFDRRYDDFVRVARRDMRQAVRWAGKSGAELGRDDARDKAKRGEGSKYQAVNNLHDATVEFRIFRGTLNAKTIRAAVDLCLVIAKRARRIPWRCVDDAARWFEYCKPETLAYINSRGAFQDVTAVKAAAAEGGDA